MEVNIPNLDSQWNEFVSARYEPRGKPGISYARYIDKRHGPKAVYETLLYYDSDGALAGMFEYCPNDIRPPYPPRLQRKVKDLRGCKDRIADAGSFYIIVNPKRQRKGIGTKLLVEAVKRWPIKFDEQKYSKAGWALVSRLLKK